VEDGATSELNAVGVFEGERDEIVVENPPPAIQKADELVTIVVDAFANRGIDYGIQSGAIAATGQ